jgi:hypothetical protein
MLAYCQEAFKCYNQVDRRPENKNELTGRAMQESENLEITQYEAPSIEAVITEDDMQREVAYAGVIDPSSVAPA